VYHRRPPPKRLNRTERREGQVQPEFNPQGVSRCTGRVVAAKQPRRLIICGGALSAQPIGNRFCAPPKCKHPSSCRTASACHGAGRSQLNVSANDPQEFGIQNRTPACGAWKRGEPAFLLYPLTGTWNTAKCKCRPWSRAVPPADGDHRAVMTQCAVWPDSLAQ